MVESSQPSRPQLWPFAARRVSTVPYQSSYAETNITVGQQTKSGHAGHVTDHAQQLSDKMAGRKRVVGRFYEHSSSSTSSCDTSDACSTKKAKRQVSVSTFEKWQRNFDRDHQTLTWLRCDKDHQDWDLVALLWCAVCREFQNKICGMKNFTSVGYWVNERATCWTTLRASNIKRRWHTTVPPKPRQATSQLLATLLSLDVYYRWETLNV